MIKKHGGKSSYYIIRNSYDYILYQYIVNKDTVTVIWPPDDFTGTVFNCIALFKVKRK